MRIGLQAAVFYVSEDVIESNASLGYLDNELMCMTMLFI